MCKTSVALPSCSIKDQDQDYVMATQLVFAVSGHGFSTTNQQTSDTAGLSEEHKNSHQH